MAVGETQFAIGAEATCTDGTCGVVTRVIVDPVARALTHLVVEPKHREGIGRLVPLDLIDTSTGEIRVRCAMAAFDKLDAAEETRFVSQPAGYGGYSQGQALAWPYYGMGGMQMAGMGTGGLGQNDERTVTTYDTVPLGEVSVRRGERVHATDGDIGQVQGLVIDPRSHQVTHVLLQEGHLWGRKEVAIPIGAVTGVEDGVQLNITKRNVEDLPAVEVDHSNG